MIATMSIEKSIIIDSDSYVVIASPPSGDEPNSRYLTLKGSIACNILAEYYNRSYYVYKNHYISYGFCWHWSCPRCGKI